MTTASTHHRLLPFAFLLSVALLAAVAAQAPAQGSAGSPAYGWPVKPFDRAHPVRGSFGDPRTIFTGPPTRQTLLAGGGLFLFHFGVDISAPDGTAVYPVESGRVVEITEQKVTVAAGGSRSFEYWHIAASVRVGQQVTARTTVLGHILRSCGHVHLSELDGGVFVNPLLPGHLAPYADTTRPVVHSIALASPDGGNLMPELVRGRVEIVVDAYDLPQLPVPSPWHGLPVTPALIEWRIVRAATGRVVVPTRVAYDVRSRVPADRDFWRIYARGTHQNMSVFGKHYSYMQPGLYLFRLAPGGFDTAGLPDQVYDLVVKATDSRGNSDSLTLRFSVHNRPGDVGV